MAHYPLNHHLRQTYRFLAGLTGLYLALVGIIGLTASWGGPLFERGHDWVLGQRINPAAAWMYAIVGVVLLVAVLVGGHLYHVVALGAGWGLCGIAMLVMAFMQTDANILNASMSNVVTLAVLGLIVLTAGLYGKVGTSAAAHAEHAAAHGPR